MTQENPFDQTFHRRLVELHQRVERLRELFVGRDLLNREDLLQELSVATAELSVAEEELHQQSEELSLAHHRNEQERQRFQSFFFSAPDAYLVTDLNGAICHVNRQAANMLGVREDHLPGKPLATYVDRQDVAAFRQAINNITAGLPTQLRLRIKPRSGAAFPAAVTASRIDAPGASGTLSWMIRDVSGEVAQNNALEQAVAERTAALQQALEREQQARDAAETANRAKDQFLAVLSHELRTPLTPVLSLIEDLSLREDLPDDLDEDLCVLRRNVELEARLIDDLLDLSRITRGKLSLRRTTVDVRPLLQQVIEMCRDEIADKQLEITLNCPAKRHHVEADAARLQQVFWNLIKNAVKFTPEHGRIDVDVSSDDGNVQVSVSDNGIGIAPDALPRLFAAFEQGSADMRRRFGGLGLGLAISRALVEAHGGTIEASSDGVGQGATFVVRFPEASVPPVATNRHGLPGYGADHPQRILLVEDNQDTLRVLTRLLRKEGYEVTPAASVHAALSAAGAQPFDLIISDIGLPDGNGIDLMRTLRSQTDLRGIALSGFGMEDDLRRSREAGFEQHLIKPVNFDKVLSAIQQIAPGAQA